MLACFATGRFAPFCHSPTRERREVFFAQQGTGQDPKNEQKETAEKRGLREQPNPRRLESIANDTRRMTEAIHPEALHEDFNEVYRNAGEILALLTDHEWFTEIITQRRAALFSGNDPLKDATPY